MLDDGRRISVTGHVQGVGYRYFCLKQAEAMSICGAAENMSDGSVEILAVGEPDSLEAYIVALRQGPRNAKVESVETRALEPSLIERMVIRGGFVIG